MDKMEEMEELKGNCMFSVQIEMEQMEVMAEMHILELNLAGLKLFNLCKILAFN